jgi:S1-C subfamily serine protease
MYVVAMDKSTCKELAFTDMSDIAKAVAAGKSPEFQHTDTCSDKLLKDLEEQRRPGVVQVIRGGKTVGHSYGSGFFAGDDADTVVTNFHVVAGNKTLTVRTDTGETFPAKVEKMDEINDLALLRVQGLKTSVRLNLPLAPEGAPMPSLEVTAVGHKLGKPWAGYSKGSLASEKSMPYVDTWNLGSEPTAPDAAIPEVQGLLRAILSTWQTCANIS